MNDGDKAQFPGWPIAVAIADNDGRKPVAWLPELVFQGAASPVVQVIDEQTTTIVYTVRVQGDRFHPQVYAPGKYTIRIGRDAPDGPSLNSVEATAKHASSRRTISI